MVNRIVTALYNLGVLLIATAAFKSGIEFFVGVAVGFYWIIMGFVVDLLSQEKRDD